MAANNQADYPNLPSDEDKLPPPEPAHPSSLSAKCHCGRISVEIPSLPTKMNECRCSICYRYGAQWGYYHYDDVNIVVNVHATRSAAKDHPVQQEPPPAKQVGEDVRGLQYYVRDDMEGHLGFYFCGNCGCLTHWAPTEQGLAWLEEERKTKGPDAPWKKVGVNCRMLAPHLLEGVEKKTGPLGELSSWDFKQAAHV
ncbi:putative glutathione-dependent formaldehyde-activating gfa [Diaporthe ampelina]|uniref:Putative glutathione-dependent formaldehyde-activating gfa n=1 Tax=Diaporthe ampelina TaxID=1214573 RepID=A0A0G2F664_9PEZI|nr:putative glutathione-dependent formaldehyde-activating gfa [Diaporthe ampelina]